MPIFAGRQAMVDNVAPALLLAVRVRRATPCRMDPGHIGAAPYGGLYFWPMRCRGLGQRVMAAVARMAAGHGRHASASPVRLFCCVGAAGLPASGAVRIRPRTGAGGQASATRPGHPRKKTPRRAAPGFYRCLWRLPPAAEKVVCAQVLRKSAASSGIVSRRKERSESTRSGR
ncbi:unnamed protein product [Amoebophrya sp. A120]|nr:unnamed protein product [Amoebophrya sp. A120]|eukprot:GSA120T00024350001.1